MKNAVIICEFNPLHAGHKRLLDFARSCGAENVICVMSGNAVQRGELACMDKYTRAGHAVLAGADAVIELPAEYTLSAAKQFALGGVKIANCIKDATLVFGSECGDIAALEKLATALDDPDVNERIKDEVSVGTGYPAAVAKAIGETDLLSTPNNTLGIEYIRAIINTGRKISAITLKRESTPDQNAPIGYPTSSSLRESARKGEKISSLLSPSYVLEDLEKHVLSNEKYYALLRYILTAFKAEGIYDDVEGLSNRLSSCAEKADTYDKFCALAAAKRYTRARVKRLALNTVIQNRFTHAELTEKPINFVNVLAVAEDKKQVLSQINVPVALSAKVRDSFKEDFALTDRVDRLFASAVYPYPGYTVFVER